MSFVVRSQHSDAAVSHGPAVNSQAAVNPLDQVSSAEIAVHAAKLANLDAEEVKEVVATSDTVSIMMATTQADDKVIAKPQVVNTTVKTKKDIQTYTTVEGDTVSGLATKFSVTSDSIRWSNGIASEGLGAGKKLLISPISDGIVYVVKAGDTPDSLAQRFNANKDQIVTFNDAEKSGLIVGDTIVIPGGSVRAVAAVGRRGGGTAGIATNPAFSWTRTLIPVFGGNSYPYGQCTFWAANRRAEVGRPIPNNLGNASAWLRGWQLFGMPYGKQPVAGAVIYFPGNHVGFVERVNPDGSVYISHMNWYGVGDDGVRGGRGKVTRMTIPANQVGSYWFLY